MQLAQYLDETGETSAAFAERAGVDKSTVSRWLRGCMPKIEQIKRVDAVTGGRVTANDFVSCANRTAEQRSAAQ